VPDFNESGTDSDLMPLNLSVASSDGTPPAATVTLRATSGAGNFKVWAGQARSGLPLLDPNDNEATWNASIVPAKLWLEAVAPSNSISNTAFSLEYDPDGPNGAPSVNVDTVRLTAVQVNFTKVWSDQIPGVEVNSLPAPPNRKQYILMAARENQGVYGAWAKANLELTPNASVVREKLLFGLRADNATGPLRLGEVADDAGRVGLFGDTQPFGTERAAGTMHPVWGIDGNGDGLLNTSELAVKVSHTFRVVTEYAYLASRSILNTIREGGDLAPLRIC
jgi:hypothetical protein